MKLHVGTLDDLPKAVSEFLQFINDRKRKFVVFRGEMGAGKTTFINEVLVQLGVEEAGSSPTFSIVNEYFSVNYGTIYHFDFYRIEDEMEAYDLGVEEIFEEDAYIFIEWPERIENILPSNIVSLSFTVDEDCRTLELEVT